MFDSLTKEKAIRIKRILRYIGRFADKYLTLLLFSLYIYWLPLLVTKDPILGFIINPVYIIGGSVLTVLMFYSLTRLVNVYNSEIAFRFIYAEPRITRLSDKLKFIFTQKEYLIELGILAISYLILPQMFTSPCLTWLLAEGDTGFSGKLQMTLIILPVFAIVYILANLSAIKYWDTAERCKEANRISGNGKEMHPPLRNGAIIMLIAQMKEIEKYAGDPEESGDTNRYYKIYQAEQTEKKEYNNNLRITIVAYFLGSAAAPYIFTVLSPAFILLTQPEVLTAIALLIVIPLIVRTLRAILKRRRFIKELTEVCRKRRYVLSKVKYPYKSLFSLYKGESFNVRIGERRFSCKLISSKKYSSPIYIMPKGVGAWLIRFRPLRFELFSYTKSFSFAWEADYKKVVIINPVPISVLLPKGNKATELDNGDIVDGYEFYTATGFLNALERDVIDVD